MRLTPSITVGYVKIRTQAISREIALLGLICGMALDAQSYQKFQRKEWKQAHLEE